MDNANPICSDFGILEASAALSGNMAASAAAAAMSVEGLNRASNWDNCAVKAVVVAAVVTAVVAAEETAAEAAAVAAEAAEAAAVAVAAPPLPKNIADNTRPASASVGARKIANPVITTSIVYTQTMALGILRRRATPYVSIVKNNPWNNPHTTNVQLAPCQSPVKKNTMTLFAPSRSFPRRLPPSGIYT